MLMNEIDPSGGNSRREGNSGRGENGSKDHEGSHMPHSEEFVGVPKILKALADPGRLRMVEYAALGVMYPSQFEEYVGLKQSTVSYHLRVLVDAGIFSRMDDRCRTQGYVFNGEVIALLGKYLSASLTPKRR